MAVDLLHSRRAAYAGLVPDLNCPVPGPGGGPGPGGSCDVCALLGPLLPVLLHAFAAGVDGGGSNSGIVISDGSAAQLGSPNPKRVAFGISIPAGAKVYWGFTSQVSPTPGNSNAGTPVPSGASWLFGPEWTGAVWVVSPGPYGASGLDIRKFEISAP